LILRQHIHGEKKIPGEGEKKSFKNENKIWQVNQKHSTEGGDEDKAKQGKANERMKKE